MFGYGEYKHSYPNFEHQRKPKSALIKVRFSRQIQGRMSEFGWFMIMLSCLGEIKKMIFLLKRRSIV